jgi:hypothetical protein
MNQMNMYDILDKLRAISGSETVSAAVEQIEKLNGVKNTKPLAETAKEKAVDESGLQAYLGKKKYGETGMKALQQAGREGASKEKMAKIRAKHDKMDEAAKPDYIDLDKDGNRIEPMKQAAKDAKKHKKDVEEGVYQDSAAKSKIPAFQRKAKGGDWKMSTQDLENERSKSPTGREGLEKAKRRLGQMTEGIGRILSSMDRDIAHFKSTGNLTDRLYTALYDYYLDSGEMPYGVAKAREGDPYDWISSQLESVLGIDEGNLFTGNLAKARAAGKKQADLDGDGDMEKVNELDLNLIKAAQKHAKELPSNKDSESERNIHKKYGHRSDRDDSGNDDDYDEWGNEKKKKAQPASGEKRGRGRPKKYTADKPRQERVTAKSRKADRTAYVKKKTDEGFDDVQDQGEYDQEGDMAKDQLHTLVKAAKELHGILGDDQNLPEWVQTKITKALDYINASNDYMDQEEHDMDENPMDEAVRGTVFGKQGYRAPQTQGERDTVAQTIKQNRAQNRADTRVSGYGSKIALQRGVSSADTGGARGSAVNVDQSGQATDFNPGTGNIDPRAQGYRGSLNLGKGSQGKGVVGEEDLDEKAVSKKQQRFMGMVHAAQKGEKPASKEVAKVAKDMGKKDAKDFASTKHKGLPEKVKPAKKKSKDVEETTTAGSVATAPVKETEKPAASKGGMTFGKGIYDSVNRELEAMISENMQISTSSNSDSSHGGPSKTLTITATDEDAMQLAQLLQMAGLPAQTQSCSACGESNCGCDSVSEELANSPDEVTADTQVMTRGLAGGLNKEKSTGQTTLPVISHQKDRQGVLEAEQRLWNLYNRG